MASRQRTNPEHCQKEKQVKYEAKGMTEKSSVKTSGTLRVLPQSTIQYEEGSLERFTVWITDALIKH